MSTTHKLGRSLPIAGVAALLVVGASFAHDSAPSAPAPVISSHEVGTGDDDRQINAVLGSDEDELAGKIEDDSEAGDQDENDQGENEDQDDNDQVENADQDQTEDHDADHDQAAPHVANSAKTHKAKPVTHVVKTHHAEEANDDRDDNGGAEDGDHEGSHDGDHDDGGHDGDDDGGSDD